MSVVWDDYGLLTSALTCKSTVVLVDLELFLTRPNTSFLLLDKLGINEVVDTKHGTG